MKIIISALIFILVCIPAIIISVPVVAILLATSWGGRTTIFGNTKWGDGTSHPDHNIKTYWDKFVWLVIRNPVNNLMSKTLGINPEAYFIIGDPDIGDKIKGGYYIIKMGLAWEYYWIKPYGSRCIRARIGWKINNNAEPKCPYVFVVNPWKNYTGVSK